MSGGKGEDGGQSGQRTAGVKAQRGRAGTVGVGARPVWLPGGGTVVSGHLPSTCWLGLSVCRFILLCRHHPPRSSLASSTHGPGLPAFCTLPLSSLTCAGSRHAFVRARRQSSHLSFRSDLQAHTCRLEVAKVPPWVRHAAHSSLASPGPPAGNRSTGCVGCGLDTGVVPAPVPEMPQVTHHKQCCFSSISFRSIHHCPFLSRP